MENFEKKVWHYVLMGCLGLIMAYGFGELKAIVVLLAFILVDLSHINKRHE